MLSRPKVLFLSGTFLCDDDMQDTSRQGLSSQL